MRRELSRTISKNKINPHFVVHCINEAILYGARLLHTRTLIKKSSAGSAATSLDVLLSSSADNSLHNRVPTKDNRGICTVSVNEAIRMGLQAYIDAFSELNTDGKYNPLIKILRARTAHQ